MDTRTYLRARWLKTFAEFHTTNEARYFNELFDRYGEPHRHYHTPEHLRSCFEVLDRMIPEVDKLVELALWYHDYKYNTLRIDNEEFSARVAARNLTPILEEVQVHHVVDLIMATTHSEVPKTRGAQVLVDVDLSILGAEPELYDKYEQDIRKEYDWVPQQTFAKERVSILRKFITDRPCIYSTPEFRSSPYETRARENLTRSINHLTSNP